MADDLNKNYLVSIIIPTKNSEKTIESCLNSVFKQDYSNIEVIVVDSFSIDKTKEIATKYGVKIILSDMKLLGARYEGLNFAKGNFILLLDSDQILEKTTVTRAIGMVNKYDMLCLEERSYKPKNLIANLFQADRTLIHNNIFENLDPLEGVLLARFYKREVLEKAFIAIPNILMPFVVAHDHAIIYYEAYLVSNRVGLLLNSVWHIEPSSIIELWNKNFRYGKTTKELVKKGLYQFLLKKKVRFRKRAFGDGNFKRGIKSTLLLVLKGIPYQLGYWST